MSRDFTTVGRALSAPVRSTFVNMLMDGSSRPASELAAGAGVKASTASEHLAVLIDAGIVTCAPRGRHRFYRLANGTVATALEQLGHLVPVTPTTTYRQSRETRALAHARLCYDHLAGRLGVSLADAMRAQRWLHGDELAVTSEGRRRLTECGIDIPRLCRGRRTLTRPCADWTERRPHLAGALGAALASLFLERVWVQRRDRSRGLIVTQTGAAALAQVLGAQITAEHPNHCSRRADQTD